MADRAGVEPASHRLTAERVTFATTCQSNWLPRSDLNGDLSPSEGGVLH